MSRLALDEQLSRKILRVLEEAYPLDLSIEEVAKKSGIHRNTVAKYLAVLSAAGQIELRSVGKAKLYRLKKAVNETGKLEIISSGSGRARR